ncbi:MAG TPA: hypothetical protein VFB79_00665, partial [Candidatus Angelobacter sp.]|nr:hypothetical protein [Candidatus Angelobacter sp.]
MNSAVTTRKLLLTAVLGITALLPRQLLSSQSNAHPSTITIHVAKSGLFSGFAHNHVVVAPIAHVNVDKTHLSAAITVLVKDMKVTDPEVSDKDRAEIQSTM